MLRARSLDQVAEAAERLGLRELARHDPLWPGQLAVLVAIALNFTLPERVTVGPTWVTPAAEGLALLGLIAMTPHRNLRHSARRRAFALGLTGLVSATNIVSLTLLVHHLLRGGKAGGHPLVIAGVVLWLNNVLLFAVWYWQLDRGGPISPEGMQPRPDFLFAQMTDARDLYPEWRPNFVDYLYLSLTNAAAFSPTDTLPLTRWAKVLMGVQSLAALVTVGLVVARAVNILS